MSKYPLHFTIILLFLTACGKQGNKKFTPGLDQLAFRDDREGTYRAYLRPLNGHQTKGTVTVRLEQDEFVVREAIADAPENIMHFQFIVSGKCPSTESDTNADGFVDMNEAMAKLGKILIPLDSHLDSQIDGSDYGPLANPAGAIVYNRRGSLSKMLADLYAVDPSADDHLGKLNSGEKFVLHGKSVVILGTKMSLPDTVGSFAGLSRVASLPIACGEFIRKDSDSEDLQNLDL
jgi:hypothetical protein